MQKVEAFIKSHRLDELVQVIQQINGVTGMSVTDVRGFGRGRPDGGRELSKKQKLRFFARMIWLTWLFQPSKKQRIPAFAVTVKFTSFRLAGLFASVRADGVRMPFKPQQWLHIKNKPNSKERV